MSQEDLAKAADVTATTIARTEKNRTIPELGTMKRIADALGVPFDQMLATAEGTSEMLVLPKDLIDAMRAEAAAHAPPLNLVAWLESVVYRIGSTPPKGLPPSPPARHDGGRRDAGPPAEKPRRPARSK